MVDENVSGSVQENTETPEVKEVQAIDEVASTQTQEEVKQQEQEEVQPQKPEDPDEKIIREMFESGKNEVETGELISAGFTPGKIVTYAFEVGDFKLSRLLMVSPYKIEKKQ